MSLIFHPKPDMLIFGGLCVIQIIFEELCGTDGILQSSMCTIWEFQKLHVGAYYLLHVYVRYMGILDVTCFNMYFGKTACQLRDMETPSRSTHAYLISAGHRLYQALSFGVMATEKSWCRLVSGQCQSPDKRPVPACIPVE